MKKRNVVAVCFWLLLWQAASFIINQPLLLVSPVIVAIELCSMMVTADFWQILIATSIRIAQGFLSAMIAGIILAVCAFRSQTIKTMLAPFLLTVRSIPFASFVILALLWLKNAGQLAVLISFLISLPVFYEHILVGCGRVSASLVRMAKVFRFSKYKKIRYLYLPAVMPDFRAACQTASGLSWKSGIAAELIGITSGSIGEQLYEAKLLLETKQLFAWTIVIIIMSLLFEKTVVAFTQGMNHYLLSLPKRQKKKKLVEEPISSAIQVKDLGIAYENQCVVSDVSFSVQAGHIACLVAASGVGKSSILSVLWGETFPQEGIYQCEKPAVVFQEDCLIEELCAVHQILLVCDASIEEIIKELLQIGFTQEQVMRPVSTLSGGQRRRVAILRALMAQDTKTLLLDEPLKGLDEQTKKQVCQTILRLARGRAILQTAHEPEQALAKEAEIIFI